MQPDLPDFTAREHLLDVLGELVAKAGAARLLLPPVEPGPVAFPDAWMPSASGVSLLLRRLAWHAGLDRDIKLVDERAGAPPNERKPATRIGAVEVSPREASFALRYIGEDDIAGTLAHEIGVAYAALHRPERDPYRGADNQTISVDPDLDLERGSIATVYLGLGTLAANAARQYHAVLEGQGFNPLLVATVKATVEAGHLPMESLAYLLAVQTVVRGDTRSPVGLAPEQRRAVEAWIAALRDSATELQARLGIVDASPARERPAAIPFDAAVIADDAPRANAFRWRTHRAGIGTVAGTVLGLGLGVGIASAAGGTLMALLFGGAFGGHLIGRQIQVVRCSACATVLPKDAAGCTRCGAKLRGEITSLSERLDAEDRLGPDAND